MGLALEGSKTLFCSAFLFMYLLGNDNPKVVPPRFTDGISIVKQLLFNEENLYQGWNLKLGKKCWHDNLISFWCQQFDPQPLSQTSKNLKFCSNFKWPLNFYIFSMWCVNRLTSFEDSLQSQFHKNQFKCFENLMKCKLCFLWNPQIIAIFPVIPQKWNIVLNVFLSYIL